MQTFVHALQSVIHTEKSPQPVENPLAVPAKPFGASRALGKATGGNSAIREGTKQKQFNQKGKDNESTEC
jgi:hypothetical protein